MLAIALLLGFVCGTFASDYLVKDYHKAPIGWTNIGRASPTSLLSLKIGLAQGNFSQLEQQLYEVSDPSHTRYGDHLSMTQVHELTRPQDDTLWELEDWLDRSGINSSVLRYTAAKTWVKLRLSVRDAELLLHTEFFMWKHTDGTVLIRTESYSLPASLHQHITTIQPTNSWSNMGLRIPLKHARSTNYELASASLPDIPPPPDSAIAALCNFTAVSPECLRTLYGTASYTVSSGGRAKLGFTDFLGEYTNQSDTYQFLQQYRPEAAEIAYSLQQTSINGGAIDNGTNTADTDIGLEGNLDAQFLIGVGK